MYQVLARKWRPKKFSEMVGQKHVLRMLENALKSGRLHHAYLFSGTRGVGKTTISRLLAKCLNCEQGISSEPCCKCDSCLAIDAGKFIDLIEVDAASRTKVEDTRTLLENVQYAPALGRFKIYLIDEIHMLSGHSFNALLKTLEEPPEHVKFFLATTDPERLPVTVLSRCLQFNLTHIAPETIAQHLKQILNSEKIAFEDEAIWQIALAGKGSVRDALSVLDQAISYCANNITAKDVNIMLGTLDRSQVIKLLELIAEKNSAEIFTLCDKLHELNSDFSYLLDEIILLLSNVAIQQMVPNAETFAIEWAQNHKEKIQALAKALSRNDVQLYYQIALLAKRDLPFSPSAIVAVKMAILRMLNFNLDTQTGTSVEAKTQVASAHKPTTKAASTTNKNAEPIKVSKDSNWQQILGELDLTGPTKALLQHVTVKEMNGNTLVLIIAPSHAPLANPRHEKRIQDALQQKTQQKIKVHIEIGKSESETPAQLKSRINKAETAAATQSLEQDANLKSLIDTFGATIMQDSIKKK